MNKRLSSLTALLLAALLLLAGCGKTPSASVPASSAPASSPASDPASAPTGPTEPAAPAAPDLSKLDLPTFPDRNIYFSQCGDNLLLLYILPGLDASQTAVVHVSLSQNKVLGTYDLGEGNFYVTATQKGFLAVNAEAKKLLLYTDGSKREVDLPVSGTYPFFSLSRDGQTVVSYDFDSSLVEQYSVADGRVVRSEKLNIALWEVIGMTDSAVYFSSDKGTYRFDRRNGQIKLAYDITFYYMTDRHLIGQQGDYFAVQDVVRDKRLLYSSLTEGEAVLTDTPEYLLTQTSDGRLVRYDFAAGTCAAAPLDTETFCIDCALFGDRALVSLMKEGGASLKTVTFDDAQPLTAQEWDLDTYEGVMPLPPVTGSDETVARINYIRDTYGVRILYGPELFGMEGLSASWTEVTEQQIRETDCFDSIETALQYFPDGMLREIGQGRDIVLYLCDNLDSNGIDAAGNCIFMNHYAYIMLEYNWSESYAVPMLIHELFHACEYCIEYSVLSRWDEELPEEARAYADAYGAKVSTDYVYGYPGKKVWYSSLYAKTNAKEDRAVTFEHLYDSFRYDFANEFEYAGMRQKAQLIADMLRATFESCRTADTLPWEKFL